MVGNIYLLLDLDENTPWSEVENKYSEMVDALESIEPDGESRKKIEEAKKRLSDTFNHLSSTPVRMVMEHKKVSYAGEGAYEESYCRPKLGQLLVAYGVLNMEELDTFLEIQKNTKTEYIPLGMLLVGAGYLTHEQLDYYLRLQCVLELPSDHPERWGQRLIQLGLVTEDQLKVALIEQTTTGCTLRQALINRGWLSSSQLDRIF